MSTFDEILKRESDLVNEAKKLGFYNIKVAYDDINGGLYIGGVRDDGEWTNLTEIRHVIMGKKRQIQRRKHT